MTLVLGSVRLSQKLSKLHREHSGAWAREDPAMAFLCMCAASVVGASYSVALSPASLSLGGVLASLAWGGLLGVLWFVASGVACASAVWWALEHLGRDRPAGGVEWAFCFDLHCKGCVPLLLVAAAHLLLLPVMAAGWAGGAASNCFFALAVLLYWGAVDVGARALPQLEGRGPTSLLLPGAVALVAAVVASLAGADLMLEAASAFAVSF
ncbi:hypothetical protein FNF29_08114 [Cafeteria roenbergensis]|nr:hypothetical protein FNF29_08114 [Cafeteria roenbergensis]|eukprot:KAA0146341.1 hypothetical protein FNF29_08114 [Cafeteria roenbergensis]